jgi:hypothetical protein
VLQVSPTYCYKHHNICSSGEALGCGAAVAVTGEHRLVSVDTTHLAAGILPRPEARQNVGQVALLTIGLHVADPGKTAEQACHTVAGRTV